MMASNMTTYESTYSQMNDEQILNVASDRNSLCAEARSALDLEMAKRGLGKHDVDGYIESVRIGQLEDAQRKPLAQTFNGFGTHLYGKRDFRPDGSYLTTLWVVLFWIPVIPLKSVRVIDTGSGKPTLLPGKSHCYRVLDESRPDARQVMNVYSFMVLPFIVAKLLDLIHAGSLGALVAVAFWVCVPWSLRRLRRSVP